jgi:hypothetical protein
MRTIVIVAALVLLWLMFRRRAVVPVPVGVPAYGYGVGVSTAGLAAAGAFVGGAIKGYKAAPSATPQPTAAAGISGASSAGLGDTAPVSDDDLLGLLSD